MSASVKFTMLNMWPPQPNDKAASEIRRCSICRNSGSISFNAISQLARTLFGIPKEVHVWLLWKDENDDNILMTSEIEFKEFETHWLNLISISPRAPMRLGVTLAPRSESCPAHSTSIVVPDLKIRNAVIQEIKKKKQQSNQHFHFTAEIKSIKALAAVVQELSARPVTLRCAPRSAGPTHAAPQRTKNCTSHYHLRVISDPLIQNIPPGTDFVQKLKICNDGQFSVKYGLKIVFCGGKTMCGPNFEKSVGPIKIGEQKSIFVNLRSPSEPGAYWATFQCMLPCGLLVGPPFQVKTTSSILFMIKPKQQSRNLLAQLKSLVPMHVKPRIFEPYACSTFSSVAPALPIARQVPRPPAPVSCGCAAVDSAHVWKAEIDMLSSIGFENAELIAAIFVKLGKPPSSETGFPVCKYALGLVLDELCKCHDNQVADISLGNFSGCSSDDTDLSQQLPSLSQSLIPVCRDVEILSSSTFKNSYLAVSSIIAENRMIRNLPGTPCIVSPPVSPKIDRRVISRSV